MKFYHVETQEDYDALMSELDEQGYKWRGGSSLKGGNGWEFFGKETVILVQSLEEVSYSDKDSYTLVYPNEEIITYKAKTEKEKLGLPEWAEWITRDEDGELWVHAEEPYITDYYWDSDWNQEELDSKLFPKVAWKDQKPTKVSDFIASTKKEVVSKQSDPVNKPNHYVGIQGLEVETVLQNFIPRYTDSYEAHRIASAIEYLLRSPLKNGTEDVKKAKKEH